MQMMTKRTPRPPPPTPKKPTPRVPVKNTVYVEDYKGKYWGE